MDKFNEFVNSCGGARKAAQALDVSESLISLIKLGQRNISYRQAQKIESITSGRISRKDLRPDIYG
jgi:DNA-binding transcriptional regulator YdaS (Cro superfamily)